MDLTKISVGRWTARMAAVIGCLLLLYQWNRVFASAINIPRYDAWNFTSDIAWTRHLSVSWLVSFHNEHRILPSRLLTWILYQLTGWDIRVEAAVAHLLYIALCVYVVTALNRRCRTESAYFFLPMFASTFAYENQVSGFQTCFHFTLLFFFVALDLAARRDHFAWLAPVCALISAYALASGLALALGVALYLVLLAMLFPSERKRAVVGVVMISAGIKGWFIGRWASQTPPTPPWRAAYWDYLANLVSMGFGYVTPYIVPGMLILSLCMALLALLWAGKGARSKEELAVDAFVLCGLAGLLLALGAVAYGRASFGPGQAKSSRYAELSMFLIPLLWLTAQRVRSESVKSEYRIAGALAALLVLWWPMRDGYDYTSYVTYKVAGEAGKACFVAGQASGEDTVTCPQLYPSPMPKVWLEQAGAAKFSFAEKEHS